MKKIISLLYGCGYGVLRLPPAARKMKAASLQSSASSVSSTPEKLDTACNVFALNGPTGIGTGSAYEKGGG